MAEAALAPHVLLISFPAQGHVNPLLRLAKRLAAKGLYVTFASSHDIGHRIYTSTNTLPGDSIPIGDGFLRFEFFSDGWAVDDPRRAAVESVLPVLRDAGSAFVAGFVRREAEGGRPVSCIVNNPFIPWALDVAEELGISSAVLWVQSCAAFAAYYHYFHSPSSFPDRHGSGRDATVGLPGLPPLASHELPSFLFDASQLHRDLKEAILSQFRNIHKATWVLANTFEELERAPIEAVSKLINFTPVGPLIDAAGGSELVRADLWKAEDCTEWLDAQKPRSVVYVSFGSVVVLGRDEIVEMASALKSSGRPFLWVVRDDCWHFLPGGFLEDVEGRGVVVGWSSQEVVLAHGAVACFATHCGWNSSLELLAAGVPVIAYGQWGDQVTNAKFLVEVYGVGVRLRPPVRREEFLRCIEEVLSGGEKAERIRERSSELKDAATRAVAEGGSSERNIQAFVDAIGKKASTSCS